MSGSTGADRIASRQDFRQFLLSYKRDVISKFPGFVSATPSGSYNSDPSKETFGDQDLIVHISSDQDKATVKRQLVDFFNQQPDTVIVPFTSAKYAGRRTYNSGEIVTVRYHDPDLGYSAQIDNIIALDSSESDFKQGFLDMPASKQGLILGLVKVAAIEARPADLFTALGIWAAEKLAADQEYEFTLSSSGLQLRLVTYDPGTYREASRQVIWSSRDFADLQRLLYQYDLTQPFEQLLQQAQSTLENPRSRQRVRGVFNSMVSVKSGEAGTAKGAEKTASLAEVNTRLA